MNLISGRKGSKNAIPRADKINQRLSLWKEHFQSLLGHQPEINDLPIELVIEKELPISADDFTME